MKFLNSEIYEMSKKLNQTFSDHKTTSLPIKVSFRIYKNKQTLEKEGRVVEQCLFQLYDKYGTREDNGVLIPAENLENFQKEYDSLMNIVQDLDIYKIKISEIDASMQITNEEMEAIFFMIDEKEELLHE